MKFLYALVLFAALFLIAGVQGDLTEDFEDDTLGQNPSEFWYTYDTNFGTPVVNCPSAPNVDGKCVRLNTGTAGAHMGMNFDDEAFDFVQYTLAADGALGAGIWDWYVTMNDNSRVTSLTHSEDLSGGLTVRTAAAPGWINTATFDSSSPASLTYRFDFTWANQTMNITVDGVQVQTYVGFRGGCNPCDKVTHMRFSLAPSGGSGVNMYVDNIIFGSAITTEGTTPQAPSGLSGLVTEAFTEVDGYTIVARWPVSANDPDQEQGAFAYDLYLNGAFYDTDTTTSADANGFREMSVPSSPASGGTSTIYVIARNATSGLESLVSCSIVVDNRVLFSSDKCGTNAPPVGGIGGGGGVVPGVDTDLIADNLGIDRSAFGWILGISITFGIAAAGFKTMGPSGAIGGSLAGIAVSTAFGLIPLWFILVLALLLAAVLFLRSGK